MTQYTWPSGRDWLPQRFRMRVVPNERLFQGFYSGQSQAIDLPGERWQCEFVLPMRNGRALGAQREVWMERLRPSNTVLIPNFRRLAPRGTMRGSPTLRTSAAQLATGINIQADPGETLLEGDIISFGGQVSRVMTNVTADGSGHMDSVSVWPRVRTALSAGIAIAWDAPKVEFRAVDASGVPVDWLPGDVTDELQLRFIEA